MGLGFRWLVGQMGFGDWVEGPCLGPWANFGLGFIVYRVCGVCQPLRRTPMKTSLLDGFRAGFGYYIEGLGCVVLYMVRIQGI